jgi:hypothetical protein
MSAIPVKSKGLKDYKKVNQEIQKIKSKKIRAGYLYKPFYFKALLLVTHPISGFYILRHASRHYPDSKCQL